MKRRLTPVLVAAGLMVSSLPLVASATLGADGVYPMVFPVQGGDYYYSDTFGDPRGAGRVHEGQDIMTYGVKGLPVVAVASGTVEWIGSTCCYLAIEHDDGWETWYIHLNNDTQNPDGSYTDDGLAWGIADGIEVGTQVEAGQLIGWVGDSGNAESTTPHLHFELRDPNGVAVNPYLSLQAAELAPLAPPPCPEGEECGTVAFQDQGGRFHLWSELVLDPVVTSFFYGNPGDVPFSGDWDCDGVETPGLYRRSDGYVYLRNSNTEGVADISFFFGNPGDLPLAGDFDNDGCDTVSIYRPSEARFYIINSLGSADKGLGAAEYSYLFGNPGDKPFVGDWNGDGFDTPGLRRDSNGFVYLRNSNTQGVGEIEYFYGNNGDVVFAGDWDADGDDTLGLYRPSNGTVYLRNTNSTGVADFSFFVGGGMQVVGGDF